MSYLITTRNRADYLERTLANVREFIEAEDELIVIDGGSNDRTAEVVAESGGLVSQFVSEPDSGEAHAFNKGLFVARGRYIKPITDDDYFYPAAMRRLVEEMEANADVDAIQCGGEVWRMEGTTPRFVAFRFLPSNLEPTAGAIYDNVCHGLGLLIRRSALVMTGGVSNSYVSVDGDLMCGLIECRCRVRYLDVNLYRWYVHPHSGYNKRRAFERDGLMIDVRLGRWLAVAGRDPKVMMSVTSDLPEPRDLSLFAGVWMAGLLARSPLWRMAAPASRAIGGLVSAARTVKRALRKILGDKSSSSSEVEETRLWTGQLR